MKHETPSPEQAASELGGIRTRQQRAAAKAARKPEWLWWAMAAGTILAGLAADLWSPLGSLPGLAIAGLAMLLVLGSRSKRVAAAMGYRAVPDRQSVPRKAVSGKYLLAIAFLALCLLIAVGSSTWHVPLTHTVWSVAIAAVVVLVLRPVSHSLLHMAPDERKRRHP
ncbi:MULTISPECIES: hypothetical protein [unclassified Arthrobacter]|uniref:hypothetical protein n=1 Tax=unclassified Arthrobacter TaxID=235627 RepID=UPI00159D8ADB|nr:MULTISPECIES: hypothetical protein [unclassified Arthrobacter]MCQ9166167.1 hypothetical protein [Arthrobacter sp. STN4]NVM97998.1 hypothetical protein [Arthrobacter sp. SDTb3-6]